MKGGLMKKPTQKERIKNYISQFGGITSLQAFVDLGVTQLGARIFELKRDGVNIKERQKVVKNRFGEKCHIVEYFIGD